MRLYDQRDRGGAGQRRGAPRGDRPRLARALPDEPDAWTFLVQGQGRFLAALDADFPYPIHVIERLMAEGRADGSVRDGDAKVLAGIATGCFTYPVIVAVHARAGTVDPAAAESLIAEATWAAVRTRAR
jgi:hypothetical protein